MIHTKVTTSHILLFMVCLLFCDRKWRERHDRINKSLRSTEDELSRSQKKVKKLQLIADDKKLEERDELSRRLTRAEQDLDEKNNRIQVIIAQG